MQQESKLLYEILGKLLKEERKRRGIKYTDFCYENDIPMTTYNQIMKAKNQSTFYNVFKIIRALNLNFEEFGKLLDEQLPDSIWELND